MSMGVKHENILWHYHAVSNGLTVVNLSNFILQNLLNNMTVYMNPRLNVK